MILFVAFMVALAYQAWPVAVLIVVHFMWGEK